MALTSRGEFAQTYHRASGNVTDAHGAEKREDMVFAHRIEFDVADYNHLRALTAEYSLAEDVVGILAVALRSKPHGFCSAHGGLREPFAGGIVANQAYYLPVMICYGLDTLLLGECRCLIGFKVEVFAAHL